jgi:nucleoside-diphosphate-sugar epimerase
MRIAVTGGAGFVGAHLLARLVGAGMDVTLIGPRDESRYVNALLAAGDVRFVECDPAFRDEIALRTALDDRDAVVVLAQVAPKAASPAARLLEDLNDNLARVIRILEHCGNQVRHIVHASSDSVYGDPQRQPVREKDAASPLTSLSAAQLASEHAVRIFCSAAGTSASILRYATIYGPGVTVPSTIPSFIRAALSGQPLLVDGEEPQERDYIHVADAMDATVSALRQRANGIYNIGSGIGTTSFELAQLVVWLTGSRSASVRRAGQARDFARTSLVLDTERARSELGFTAHRSLPQGLTEEIGWIKAEAARDAEAEPFAASA